MTAVIGCLNRSYLYSPCVLKGTCYIKIFPCYHPQLLVWCHAVEAHSTAQSYLEWGMITSYETVALFSSSISSRLRRSAMRHKLTKVAKGNSNQMSKQIQSPQSKVPRQTGKKSSVRQNRQKMRTRNRNDLLSIQSSLTIIVCLPVSFKGQPQGISLIWLLCRHKLDDHFSNNFKIKAIGGPFKIYTSWFLQP